MIDSILQSTKDSLGIEEDNTAFDEVLILHLNSVFWTLHQLGVGPKKPFTLDGETEEWSDFSDVSDMESVKSYVYLKMRTLFDPPTTTTMFEAIDKLTKEYEWRLTVAVDTKDGEESDA